MFVATVPAADPAGSAPAAWHALGAGEVLDRWQTRAEGLSDEEAAARLRTLGANRLPPPPRVSALTILGRQLRTIVVALLVAACAVSLLLGDWIEAAAIGSVLVINAALGFVTEWRARRAMESLLAADTGRATVRRGSRLQLLAAERLVPGDIVRLDAGNQVLADLRVIEAIDLLANEAPLSGESLPVTKTADPPQPEETPLADRTTMAYMGTTVVSGTGFGVVVATATATELGRIGLLVNAVEDEATPLERRLDALGRRLAWITVGLAGLVGVLEFLGGATAEVVIESGIALAVAAMPEALPAVATIALAVGMHRMARRHALVRRLPSVETLGSTTVICTDKTRTLTSGDMTVVQLWAGGVEWRLDRDRDSLAPATLVRLVDLAARASQAQAHDASPGTLAASNPVDVAMLRARTRFVGESMPPVPHRLLPFSSDRKLMAVFYDGAGGTTALAKGAPSAVLPLCEGERADAAIRALDPQRRAEIVAINEEMAGRGLRVLAVASGHVAGHGAKALHGLVFEGLVGIADPVADGVPATVAQLRAAGLRTVMITGDQRGTAVAVASAIGLAGPESATIDGRELDRLSPEQLATRVAGTSVFCRVSPEHKLRIVEALQRRGEIVAMLGDGINDAAALKKADVGVAMGGRGTDVAKGASAIVLQDDRFETIAAAVEEGRVIFDNIRKFVLYLFSCNVAEILVLLLASLAGLPLPVEPLQLLWLNMVTDTFPALALAVEPGDTGVMERPPRDPNQAILSRTFVTAILTYGGMITAATLAAFWWSLRNAPDQATTVAFMTLAFGQIAHLGNARSEDAVLHPLRALANPFAVAAVALATLLQLLTTWGPLASILGVATLDARAWVVVGVCGVFPAVAGQAMKVVRRRLAPAH